MPTKKFYLLIVSIVAVMLVAIAALSYHLYNQGPRVRFVRADNAIGSAAYTRNASVTIQFDRPIEQKDYRHDIDVTPAASFTAVTNTQSITLNFNDSLSHATTYKLQLEPAVIDQTGKRMKAAYAHSFSTSPARYAYLQRNYGLDEENNLADKNDHILTGGMTQDDRILFSAPEIRSFVANQTYALVAVKEEVSDHLYAIDIASGEQLHLVSELPGRVTDMAFAPRGNIALLTVQSDSDQPGASPNNILLVYDFIAKQLKPLEKTEAMQINEVAISNDGQLALIRDGLSNYYAASPFNDFEPILLGAYDDSFGFDASGSEIVFQKNGQTSSYRIADAELVQRELSDTGFVQQVSYQKGQLFSASIAYAEGESNTTIYLSKDWQDEPNIVWREEPDNSKTVYDFSESYDGNMLAVQVNDDRCQFDAIGINSECSSAQTTLYDLVTQEQTKILSGFELIWLP